MLTQPFPSVGDQLKVMRGQVPVIWYNDIVATLDVGDDVVVTYGRWASDYIRVVTNEAVIGWLDFTKYGSQFMRAEAE